MDAGLGNLKSLKAQLLNETLRAGDDYDDQLTAIGQGVARAFDKYCNRGFTRTEDDLYIASADRDHLWLPRTPVEEIAEIALKTSHETGYVEQASLIQNRDDSTGLVVFSARPGCWNQFVRVTYTGGYWFNTSEDEFPMPDGATALPEDVRLAWINQCRAVWSAVDKQGIQLPERERLESQTFELLPGVKELLNPHRRFHIA